MEKVEHELTPELKKRLAGLTGINVKKTFVYVPTPYRERDENGAFIYDKSLWTKFELRSLTGTELAKLLDSCTVVVFGPEGTPFRRLLEGEAQLQALRKAVKRWETLYDADFNIIPWDPKYLKDGELTDAGLDCIGALFRVDIYTALLSNTRLSDDEAIALT